jgi:hypothetical protein
VGVIQLVGGFFPGFRRITVGSRDALAVTGAASVAPAGAATDDTRDARPPAATVGVPQAAAAVQVAAADGPDHLIMGDGADYPVPHPGGPAADGEPGEAAVSGSRARPDSWGGRIRILGEAGNQALCVAMGALLIAGIYLAGFVITVPAFVFLYLAFVYRWSWWKTILATVIMAAALLFVPHSLGIILPSGLL